jgi:hypothetical protein
MFSRVYVHASTLLSVVVSILNVDTGHGTTARDILLTIQLFAPQHNDILATTFHTVSFHNL